MAFEDAPPAVSGSAQELLLALLDTTIDAIISVDEHHIVTLFNKGAESAFGYLAGEIVGKPLNTLLPARYRETHKRHIEEFNASQDVSRQMGDRREIRARRKSGDEFDAEASISKLDLSGRRAYVVVLRDISVRKSMQTALFESEQRLQIAAEAGRVGLFEHRHSENSVYWSPILRDILGVDDTLPASFEAYAALIPERERKRVFRAIERSHGPGGDGHLTLDYPIIRPDGSERWLTVSSRTIFEGEGAGRRAVRTIGAIRDSTEARNRQEELAARVADRTEALHQEIKQRKETEAALVRSQRMDALGQLTGGIAHDSNNLLTVITGNLEMIEDDLADGHPAKKFLREAQEAARIGADLNQRLLTFSRRRRLQPRLINLNDHVLAMTELLRRALGAPITLTTVMKPDIWPVLIDASEIENAILNLAINARDAMPKGGELRIETGNQVLSPQQRLEKGLPPGDYVRLAVTDNGTGMPPDVAARAFEPFFSTKGPGKGTGLGLSTIYGFVTQSGGSVSIDSVQGRGTTVTLLLPRTSSDMALPGEKPERSRLDQATGETVLVVEDNDQVRTLTVERLQRLGYRTLVAESGPAALAILEDGARVDLVFSDVVMPGGLSGFDLARMLKSRDPRRRILLTSGFAFEAAAASQNPEFEDRILRKPYSMTDLAKALRQALKA